MTYLVYDQVQSAGLPQHHAGLRQHPLGVVGGAARLGVRLVGQLPLPHPLVGLGVVAVPPALEGGEEGGQLLQAPGVQALVLAARIQGPSQLVAGLLWSDRAAV